jgi:hypothetical protein
MYSGYPSQCTMPEHEVAYVEEINYGMGWTGNKKLNASQVEDNTSLRNFYKLLMNALLGLFLFKT